MESAKELAKIHLSLIGTSCNAVEHWLAEARPLFVINCPSVQIRPAPSLATLADVTVASSGIYHCYPEWHDLPVYTVYCNVSPVAVMQISLYSSSNSAEHLETVQENIFVQMCSN